MCSKNSFHGIGTCNGWKTQTTKKSNDMGSINKERSGLIWTYLDERNKEIIITKGLQDRRRED